MTACPSHVLCRAAPDPDQAAARGAEVEAATIIALMLPTLWLLLRIADKLGAL